MAWLPSVSDTKHRPAAIVCWVTDMLEAGGAPELPQEAMPAACCQKRLYLGG